MAFMPQGMNIIRAKSIEKGWGINLGNLARIWKGGCIIRAGFLNDIKKAYDRDSNLPSLLVDQEFSKGLADRQASWRKVRCALNFAGRRPCCSSTARPLRTWGFLCVRLGHHFW